MRKVPDPEVREAGQLKRARVERRGCRYTYLLCVLSWCLFTTSCVLKLAVAMHELLDRVLETKVKLEVVVLKVRTDVPGPHQLR